MVGYLAFGIQIPNGRTTGEVTTTCPECSHNRKKKTDKCLSINLDTGLWNCHHCGFKGCLPKERDIVYERPEWKNNTNLSDSVLKWFETRRISAETCLKLNISEGVEFMPQVGQNKAVVHFNYFFNHKLVNVKYRDREKNFKLHKGAELILYNIDSCFNAPEVWIVEGEMDCLSLIEAGIESVVSVPNGAGNNLTYLDDYIQIFENAKIHIATDNDLKGRELREALALRFGKDKCDYLIFDGCKDANEYLIANGKIALREAAKKFIDFPLVGVFTVGDMIDAIQDLYEKGLPEGASTGMYSFDKLLKFHKGYLTTITGIPGHGKSDFLDQILIKLFQRHNWKGAFYSPENRPTELHFSKIARKITMKRWFGEDRITEQEIVDVIKMLDYNFWFIKPETDFTLKSILDHVAMLKKRKGIDWFVIDAWNKLEHNYTDSETKYIGQSLDMIVNFCERNNVHCFLVAHPTKIRKQKDSNTYEVPNLYDIAGSANFFNKTDNGITVYRDMETKLNTVYVQKVKFSHWGEPGQAQFSYDLTSGLFIPNN
jgi:twinkle protein